MKIWCLADTHGLHRQLELGKRKDFLSCDMVIFAGDESNDRDPHRNIPECLDFMEWFERLPIPHKVWIAGNHSTAIEHKLVDPRSIDAIYLENESITIEGIHIYGSPMTPTFYNWSFMKHERDMEDVWSGVPDETDILVTHGPPRMKLDRAFSPDPSGSFIHVGCKHLKNRVDQVKPQHHIFGHIHNNQDAKLYNMGTVKLPEDETHFHNCSVIDDSVGYSKPVSCGFQIEYRKDR
jgi:Icc-related predicted phosphoesterase